MECEVILGGQDREPADEVMRLTEGWGVDQVYECVGGETDALQESLAMIRPGGKIIMEGVFLGIDRSIYLPCSCANPQSSRRCSIRTMEIDESFK